MTTKKRKPAVKKPVIHQPPDLEPIKEEVKEVVKEPEPEPEVIPEPVKEPEPEVKPVGRPRREATVDDLIVKLKEVKVITAQITRQHPNYRYRMGNIDRTINTWINVILKRVKNQN